MCKMLMEMLDELEIPYAVTESDMVVDLDGLDQLLITDMMRVLEEAEHPYEVNETQLKVPHMMEDLAHEDVSVNAQANETLGLEIELFARQYIPESEDAFGKFMYHAELVKNGHYDIHMQDMDQVQEPYRTILHKMIEKGGK